MSTNKAIIVGRVGQQPEVKYLEGGAVVASFSLATTEKYTKDNEKIERTEWHNITAWGKTAELIEKYVDKGDLLYVEGRLRTEKYQKDGQDHYSTKIVVDRLDFLTSKSEKESRPATSQDKTEKLTNQEIQEESVQDEQPEPIGDQDDLPF